MFARLWWTENRFVPSQKPAPNQDRSTFGKNVNRLRAAKGLTQEKLAEKAGLSARYLQSIEAGEYFPSLPALVRLNNALKASWDDMFVGL